MHFHALKLFAFPSLLRNLSAINHDQLPHFAEMVEPIGIEPMTSSLQS